MGEALTAPYIRRAQTVPWIGFWIGLARALDRLFGLLCAGAGLGGIELGAFFTNGKEDS